ncbi:MAG: class I SAM-dependent methyltransferase [Solirubrobacterales bacterium]|nr:class I SAM-dependent methyltransferase [Solirubrobacterales bacterium]
MGVLAAQGKPIRVRRSEDLGVSAAEALYGGATRAVLDDGTPVALDLDRWLGPITAADETVLGRAAGPVLDVGCGPGRHVRALARRGVLAMGVDASPHAVGLARRRGAVVVQGSIFDEVAGAGRWGSALLLDGSIGIGGAPVVLLRRVRQLLREGGAALVETEPPGVPTRSLRLRLEVAGGRFGRPFPWGFVGADGLPGLARAAGFREVERWACEGRWFAELR